MAAVLESHSSKAPILHAGECTPMIVRDFEIAFDNYCTAKDIADEKQTKSLSSCFRDHRITDILNDPATKRELIAGTVSEFMAAVRAVVLDPSWEDDHRIAMMARRHTQAESFYTFANSIRSDNSLLLNTASHLDDDRLRTHLESTMHPDLLGNYRADSKAKAAAQSFTAWLFEVKRVDDARLRALAQLNQAIENMERRLKRAAQSDSNGAPKRSRSDAPTGGSSAANSTAKRCPPLTEDEKKLLDANQGCRRCRLPFQTDHKSVDKTCNFPSATPYVPVTQKTIDAHRKGKGKENAPAPAAAVIPSTVASHVAAVLPDISDPNDSFGSFGTSEGDLSVRNS